MLKRAVPYISVLPKTNIYIPDRIIVNDLLLNYYTSDYTFLCPSLYHTGNPAMQGGSPLLTKVTASEADREKRYYIRAFEGTTDEIERYTYIILNPAQAHLGLWPVDIVMIPEGQSKLTGLPVAHRYDNNTDADKGQRHKYALVFEYRELPKLISASRWVSRIDKHEKIRCIGRIGMGITKCLQNLNKSGYALYDMHFSRFFFIEKKATFEGCEVKKGTVFLDFSNLIYPTGVIDSKKFTCSPNEKQYPLEFADPLYSNSIDSENTKAEFDLNTQNYSLAAMLFYLFIGINAYHNPNVEDFNFTLEGHYEKHNSFLKSPKFVFSSENMTVNEKEEYFVTWGTLPENLRNLFKKALESYPGESTQFEVPTPSDWISAFQELDEFIDLI